jgi:uncharacterized protein
VDPSTPALVAEALLTAGGAAVLWRVALSRRAREARPAPALPRWDASVADFAGFLLCVVCGALLAQVAALRLAGRAAQGADQRLVVAAAGFQLGMLAGIAVFQGILPGRATRQSGSPGGDLVSGAATFAATLPILWLVTLGWQGLLGLFGVPAERQDLVDLFSGSRSPLLRAMVVLFAVVVAPVTEELVFRRGLFRYLRGRVPRWAAYVVPTLLFGALHVDWGTLHGLAALAPLTALGLVFSLAYERTGRIGTTIVAHALFNLNTILLILAGVDV